MKYKTHNLKNIKKEKHNNFFKFQSSYFGNNKGFSFIELVIMLAVFLIIIGAAVDIFISIVKHQRRILAEQELLNQVSYVEEFMSKALRVAVKATDTSCLSTVGYIYQLTQCNDGVLQACSGIKFINQSDNNACVEFALFSDVSYPTGSILKTIKNNGLAQNILSDKLKLKYAKFVLNGNKTLRFASIGDLVQPRVTILLDIQIPTADAPQEKIIQTTVSQRNLNVAQ